MESKTKTKPDDSSTHKVNSGTCGDVVYHGCTVYSKPHSCFIIKEKSKSSVKLIRKVTSESLLLKKEKEKPEKEEKEKQLSKKVYRFSIPLTLPPAVV